MDLTAATYLPLPRKGCCCNYFANMYCACAGCTMMLTGIIKTVSKKELLFGRLFHFHCQYFVNLVVRKFFGDNTFVFVQQI
jgi:hypothetical protein